MLMTTPSCANGAWRQPLGRGTAPASPGHAMQGAMPARGGKPGKRCDWCESHPLLVSYHDEEWGVPIHDDRQWYEKIVLDGAQAGLSWLTILKKREAYREALCGFDPERV